MRPDLDPAQLTPDDRTREVGAILAIGLRRLGERAARSPTSATQNEPEKPSETGTNDLAVGGGKSVTVHPG